MTTPTDGATAWASIDLSALLYNLSVARRQAPQAKVWGVVKANAYGHGALEVATAIAAQVDGLAVARVSEALALRAAGFELPLLVLAGAVDGEELDAACRYRLQLAVHDHSQLALLRAAQAPLPGCWLKIDSGMHRLGFDPAEAATIHAELGQLTGLPVGLMSHFACADDPADATTHRQLDCFAAATAGLAGPRSLANSAGIVAHPASHCDWVRPGIMLYGGAPLVGVAAAEHQLKPVMTLRSRVIAVHPLAAGEPLGYGGSWRSASATHIAVVAIGYGDGYPRHAPSGTPVLINGQRYPLVGRVSMDLITVDIGHAAVAVGDAVVLWGEGLATSEIADHAKTIDYALFCGVSSRVRRVYC